MVFLRPRYLPVGLIILVLLAIGCSESKTMPHEIIGVWKTQSKDSTDVSIEFMANKIIIVSELGVVENAVTKVKSRKGHLHNSKLYSIYYSDRGGEASLMNVLYSKEDGGVIRFKSEQDMIWKKVR